jgi:PAS domain S-box-containing protein
VGLEYFTQFYGELHLGEQGLIALYGLDGVARVRKVGDMEEFGNQLLNAEALDRIRKGELEGFYTVRSQLDGVERLYHYRKVSGYQLVVFTAQDTKRVFAYHDSAKHALVLGASIVTLLILALAAALTRYLKQLRREITIRMNAQRQVQEHNEQLSTIFQLSPDGFVSFDAKRRVSYISPAFSQLTGQGRTTLIGLDENEFSAWLNDRCAVHAAFSGLAALREQVLHEQTKEMRVIELEKPTMRVLQVGLRFSASTQVSQILYLRDVTHETEVDRMKSEFLATAAHELRTPMSSILGFSEILLASEFDRHEQLEFLKTIHSNSQLMANILNELLDLARIEARRDKDFCYEQINLRELLEDMVKGYQLPKGRSAPDLQLPTEPVMLMADAEKLRQALLNVVSNAYKYSPKGGPVHIKVRVRRTPGQPPEVCVEVIDHGMGMAPQELARICDRFYRADASGQMLGTGLGMSIVKEIIDLHHGDLSFESTPDHGTCVRLCLPLLSAPQGNAPEAQDSSRISYTSAAA